MKHRNTVEFMVYGKYALFPTPQQESAAKTHVSDSYISSDKRDT